MMQILKSSSVALLVLCAFLDVALTQNTPTVPQNCSAVDSINITSQFTGYWYEAARSPGVANGVSCVQVGFYVTPDSTLNVNVTYSNTPNNYHMTQVNQYSTSLNTNYTYGLNVTYPSTQGKMTTFKLLATDNQNYAFVCGYTNATDNSTSFGIVLTRTRVVSTTNLQQYELKAGANYSNFNASMPAVYQSSQCYINGATTKAPFIAAIAALLLALSKFLN